GLVLTHLSKQNLLTSTSAAVPDSVVDTPASKDGDTSTDPMDASDSGMINSPASSAFPRPSVPGVSASSGPSFSYNIQQAVNPLSGGQSFQPRMFCDIFFLSLSGGQLATRHASMPPPSSVAIPREASSNAANFSYNGHQQLLQNDHSLPSVQCLSGLSSQRTVGPSASHVPHPGSHHGHLTSGATPTTSNFSSPPFWTPAAPHFQPAPGAPRIPVTSGPPGRAPAQSPLNTVQSNSSPQQPFYGTYASNPPMMAPPQGVWLQPAPAGTFPSSVPPSDAQPPGTSYGVPGVASISPVVSNSMPPVGSGMLHELPPGTDNSKNVSAVGVREDSVAVEQVDAWSAHRTETGIIYYYNSVTGQSTYQKPASFKGEPDKVYSQPTPISWEKCAGTDWSLVTTNDGKRYYYNAKTKVT
ncbi:pre-mRNA-processing protein 40C, partial [Tanacetum coccineum]